MKHLAQDLFCVNRVLWIFFFKLVWRFGSFLSEKLKFMPSSEFQIAFPGCRHESNTNEGSSGPVVAQL